MERDARGFRYLLDLHWGILWGGRSETKVIERVWTEAYPATVFGAPAYALSREWQLLLLAAHAARHQWQGLKWLVDIHDLCSSGNIKWDKLLSEARHLGWEKILRLTFHACRSLLNSPIPPKYSLGIFPSGVKLFPAAPATRRKAFFPVRLLRGPLEKVGYVTRVFLVPTLAERQLLRLPEFLGFLYYLLRPLRLASKWSWLAVAQRFRKDRPVREYLSSQPSLLKNETLARAD
jgi:hypothetical protein